MYMYITWEVPTARWRDRMPRLMPVALATVPGPLARSGRKRQIARKSERTPRK